MVCVSHDGQIVQYHRTAESARPIAELERELQALDGKTPVRQIRVFTSKGYWSLNLVQRIAGAVRLPATGKLALSTGFDGAQMPRRLLAWRAGGESINSLILQGGALQRARPARASVAHNGNARQRWPRCSRLPHRVWA